MAIARITELLAPEFLEGVTELPMAELRARRDGCQEAADELSYLRRLAQGRLDIVHADLERRAGKGVADVHELVEQLKRGEILADSITTTGFGRLPTSFGPADTDGWISAELDQVADAGRLSSLPDQDEAAVRQLAEDLTELERRVSEQRRSLHDRIDVLQGEIVRRYKSGEANVDTLLH